jgi:antitoxin MazE
LFHPFIFLCNSYNACGIINVNEDASTSAYKNNFVLLKVKMATQKLTIEISESLFEKLHHFAELTGQSVECLALQTITSSLPGFVARTYDLDELLSRLTTDNLHGEIF